MINKALFTSKTDEWETPKDFFDSLNSEFHFTLDVCATKENAKCRRFLTKLNNSLTAPWADADKPETCWMNPPYGKQINLWIKKAFDAAECGTTVVCLLPSRTDTSWWHDYCMKGEIRFIRGRLKFGGSKNSAPFPSAVVIFRGRKCHTKRP